MRRVLSRRNRTRALAIQKGYKDMNMNMDMHESEASLRAVRIQPRHSLNIVSALCT